MDRRDFLKLSGLSLLSAFLPNIQIGEGMTTYTELMMKVINSEPLSAIDKEQLRVMFQEMDTNRQVVSAWQNVDKKVNSSFINFPISVIHSEVLVQDVASISVVIPPSYSHLMIFASGRTDYVGDGTLDSDFIAMQFNGDSDNNYQFTLVNNYNDGTPSVETSHNDTFNKSYVFSPASNNAPANSSNSGVCFVPHYKGSFYKQILSFMGAMDGSSTNNPLVAMGSSWWQSTSPVQEISFSTVTGSNIKSGSIFSVYGIL